MSGRNVTLKHQQDMMTSPLEQSASYGMSSEDSRYKAHYGPDAPKPNHWMDLDYDADEPRFAELEKVLHSDAANHAAFMNLHFNNNPLFAFDDNKTIEPSRGQRKSFH